MLPLSRTAKPFCHIHDLCASFSTASPAQYSGHLPSVRVTFWLRPSVYGTSRHTCGEMRPLQHPPHKNRTATPVRNCDSSRTLYPKTSTPKPCVLQGIFGGSVAHEIHHRTGRHHYQQFFTYLDRSLGLVPGSR
jgi:hypothetical protein